MFTVTQVGSWPRSRDLLRRPARQAAGADRPATEFERVADDEVRRCVRHQVEAGVDVVVDGEHRRDNFYSFVTDKLDGTRLMSLAEMLDTVEDKAAFEEMLSTLDVPASAIRNPTCIGQLARREPLAVDELRFVQQLTDKPVKVTLPGPYLLTRSMWVGPSRGGRTATRPRWATTWCASCARSSSSCATPGAAFVQFDEPVLTEIVMSEECDAPHLHVSDPCHPP